MAFRRYYSMPAAQTIPKEAFDSSFIAALRCLIVHPLEGLDQHVPALTVDWVSSHAAIVAELLASQANAQQTTAHSQR